ncbi:5' nucleotidase [Trichuris trichiura]|uniref:5'-nucleotidase n=1 Tax=Trichuris trichiura TaxID=36087 RepID=A0A077Z8G2_TRITR|nr:5' nucleotidase [Trichuris trichiura]
MLILVATGSPWVEWLRRNNVEAHASNCWRFNSRTQACSEEEVRANQCWGGVARRMTAVNKIRQEEKNVLLLDAGDQFQGTLWYIVFKHEPISHVMNLLRYDAMTVGNHEFDDGDEALASFVRKLNFPVVTTNIETNGTVVEGLIVKEIIKEIDGAKVAILGCVTAETPDLSNPDNVTFEDEVTALKRHTNRLRHDGIKIIILLSHSGIETDRKICRSTSGIDIIVGGHTNTFLYSGSAPSREIPEGPYPEVYNSSGRPCLVITDYAYGKYLGRLDVQFNSRGKVIAWSGNPILLDNTFEDDPEVAKDVEKYEEQLEEFKKVTIGSTYVSLDGTSLSCRIGECNLGNAISDGSTHLFQPKTASDLPEDGWTTCAISIINSGTLRDFSKEEPGNLTLQDAYTMIPFTSEIVLIRIQGKHLLEAFEHSVKGFSYEARHGKFLQVSGARVVYDISRPDGQRVKSLMLLCQRCKTPKYEPVDLDAMYDVATKAYLYEGGDGYHMLTNATLLKHSGVTESECGIRYFQENSPVIMGIQNRITFVNSKYHKEVCGTRVPEYFMQYAYAHLKYCQGTPV